MRTAKGAGVPRGAHRLRRVKVRGRLAGYATILAGALVLGLAGGLAWHYSKGVEEFGSGAAVAAPAPPPAAPPAAGGDLGAPGSRVPTSDGQLPQARPVAPVRLEIPAIGVTADVNAVGLDSETSEVDVPRSVDTVGWYRYGPDLSSTAGSVAIAGHVDSADEGEGAFFRLRDVARGSQLTVTGSDGEERRFVIVAKEVFAKTAVPLDRIFGRDGQPRLTLITCGGEFDAASRAYSDNVVLTAVPA